jgi:hypothetical protein
MRYRASAVVFYYVEADSERDAYVESENVIDELIDKDHFRTLRKAGRKVTSVWPVPHSAKADRT